MAGDAGPIRTGALNPDPLDTAEPSHPRRQPAMPIRSRRERLDSEQTAVHVNHSRDVRIAMRVDASHHQTR